jgi:MtN3 and saliva related transmembrane protein
MYLLLCSGISLWLIYGVMIAAPPVIAANLITLVLSLTILLLKVKNG